MVNHKRTVDVVSLVDDPFPKLISLDFKVSTFRNSIVCRERLNQTLELLKDIIKGAATYFPMWQGPQVEGW